MKTTAPSTALCATFNTALSQPNDENSKASRHFVPFELRVGDQVELPGEVAHHVSRVTRLRSGDKLALFNGNGDLYFGTLTIENKAKAIVQLESKATPQAESRLQITLLQGLAGSEKMAWAIEKATELGAAQIVPVICERSVAQISNEKADKKQAHWLNLIRAAAAQCGRVIIPRLGSPIKSKSSSALMAIAGEHDHAIVLDPQANLSLSEWTRDKVTKAVIIYVGPEGGLTKEEITLANAAGFESVRIGPRILRTETAGPTSIAALQALLGDF